MAFEEARLVAELEDKKQEAEEGNLLPPLACKIYIMETQSGLTHCLLFR